MILYHGTYTDFQEIELDKCSPYKDFGKGFYLTDILEQADAMAQKKSRIYGGSPIVQKKHGPFNESDDKSIDLILEYCGFDQSRNFHFQEIPETAKK